MDVPRVYRLHWQRRAALTAAGALMGYGAFEWFFVFHVSGRGGALGILLVIGSLYAVWYAWVYKVILADDTITVVRPSLDFLDWRQEERSTRVCLYRAELAGVVRLPSADNPQVLAFIPKAGGGEAAYVSVRRVDTDDYFRQWRDSLPDLDPEDEHVRTYLGADPREFIPRDKAKPAISDVDANQSALGSVRVSGWIVLLAVVLVPVLVGVGVYLASRLH